MTRPKLKDGHYGRLRNGTIVGPFRALENGGQYAYAANHQGWTNDGRWLAQEDKPHRMDVVETFPTLKRAEQPA